MCLITTARRSRWIASRLKSNYPSLMLAWFRFAPHLQNKVDSFSMRNIHTFFQAWSLRHQNWLMSWSCPSQCNWKNQLSPNASGCNWLQTVANDTSPETTIFINHPPYLGFIKPEPLQLGVPLWAKQDSNLRPPLWKRGLWVVHYVFILYRVVIRLLGLKFMGERVHYVPIFHVVFWYLHTNYPRHDGREATCSNISPKNTSLYFSLWFPWSRNLSWLLHSSIEFLRYYF